MTREQIEAWLVLEGHAIAASSMFYYCIAYGREWCRYGDHINCPSDTWDDHGEADAMDKYSVGDISWIDWSEVRSYELFQLYETLVKYKEGT